MGLITANTQGERETSHPGVERRGRMKEVANNLILHIHPTRVPAEALRFSYTWGLGGISALLAVLLVLTGVLLMFRYEPTVERAYLSIQELEARGRVRLALSRGAPLVGQPAGHHLLFALVACLSHRRL